MTIATTTGTTYCNHGRLTSGSHLNQSQSGRMRDTHEIGSRLRSQPGSEMTGRSGGAEGFEAARQEGCEFGFDDAVTYALGEPPSSPTELSRQLR